MFLPIRLEEGKYWVADTLKEPLEIKKLNLDTALRFCACIDVAEKRSAFERALQYLQENTQNSNRLIVRAYCNFSTKQHRMTNITLELNTGETFVINARNYDNYIAIPKNIQGIEDYINLFRYKFGGATDYDMLYYSYSVQVQTTGISSVAHGSFKDAFSMSYLNTYKREFADYNRTIETLNERVGLQERNAKELWLIDTKYHSPMCVILCHNRAAYYLVPWIGKPQFDPTTQKADIINGCNSLGLSSISYSPAYALDKDTLVCYLNNGLYPVINQEKLDSLTDYIYNRYKPDVFSSAYQVNELWLEKHSNKPIKWPNGILPVTELLNAHHITSQLAESASIFGQSVELPPQHIIDDNKTYWGREGTLKRLQEGTYYLINLADKVVRLGQDSTLKSEDTLYHINNSLRKIDDGFIKNPSRLGSMTKPINFFISPIQIRLLSELIKKSGDTTDINFTLNLHEWKDSGLLGPLLDFITMYRVKLHRRSISFTVILTNPQIEKDSLEEQIELPRGTLLELPKGLSNSDRYTDIICTNQEQTSRNYKEYEWFVNSLIQRGLAYVGADKFNGDEYPIAFNISKFLAMRHSYNEFDSLSLRTAIVRGEGGKCAVTFKAPVPLLSVMVQHGREFLAPYAKFNVRSADILASYIQYLRSFGYNATLTDDNTEKGQLASQLLQAYRSDPKQKVIYYKNYDREMDDWYNKIHNTFATTAGYLYYKAH